MEFTGPSYGVNYLRPQQTGELLKTCVLWLDYSVRCEDVSEEVVHEYRQACLGGWIKRITQVHEPDWLGKIGLQ